MLKKLCERAPHGSKAASMPFRATDEKMTCRRRAGGRMHRRTKVKNARRPMLQCRHGLPELAEGIVQEVSEEAQVLPNKRSIGRVLWDPPWYPKRGPASKARKHKFQGIVVALEVWTHKAKQIRARSAIHQHALSGRVGVDLVDPAQQMEPPVAKLSPATPLQPHLNITGERLAKGPRHRRVVVSQTRRVDEVYARDAKRRDASAATLQECNAPSNNLQYRKIGLALGESRTDNEDDSARGPAESERLRSDTWVRSERALPSRHAARHVPPKDTRPQRWWQGELRAEFCGDDGLP